MNTIQHSKYKNSGLIFEILIRQISSDTLKGIDSPAVDLIKKYFIKTELGKEYSIYESIMKSSNLTEGKANMLLDTSLNYSKKLNRKALRNLKYNLIKEISEKYNLDEFFNTKIKNYKELASLYKLIESHHSDNSNLEHILNNKNTLLEYITSDKLPIMHEKDSIDEFKEYDKELKILAYRILLEKFNNKYDELESNQKNILKQYVNSLDSTNQLRNFYNEEIIKIKGELIKENHHVNDKSTKIKIEEVVKMMNELDKNDKISNENIIDLLQFCGLVNELKKVINV